MLILFEGRDDDLYSTSSIIVMEQLNLNDEVGFFSFIWDSLIFLFNGAHVFYLLYTNLPLWILYNTFLLNSN